jgi:hypothetical protein
MFDPDGDEWETGAKAWAHQEEIIDKYNIDAKTEAEAESLQTWRRVGFECNFKQAS